MTAPRLSDSIRLVATRSAISCSRLFVESTLRHWGRGFLVDDTLPLIDELVTNAVKATGMMDDTVRWTEVTHVEHIAVRLLGFETSIRIEVWDSSPTQLILPDDPDSSIKRGCYPASRGKVVWVELPVFPPHRKPSPHPRPVDELERTEPTCAAASAQ